MQTIQRHIYTQRCTLVRVYYVCRLLATWGGEFVTSAKMSGALLCAERFVAHSNTLDTRPAVRTERSVQVLRNFIKISLRKMTLACGCGVVVCAHVSAAYVAGNKNKNDTAYIRLSIFGVKRDDDEQLGGTSTLDAATCVACSSLERIQLCARCCWCSLAREKMSRILAQK